MNQKELAEYLLGFTETYLDFPFGEDTEVYKIGDKEKNEGKIFALLVKNSHPVRLSLKCDPLLAKKLRETYETVMPAQNLNKKYWNTIICSGQISEEDLKGLIIHSYNLTINSTSSVLPVK